MPLECMKTSQNHEQLDLSSGADLLQHSSNDENSDSDALEDTAMGEQTSSSEDEQNEQNDNHGEDSQDQHQKESAPSTSAAISEEPQFQLTTPPQRKPLNRFDKLPIFSIEFSKFQQQRESELLKLLKTQQKLGKKYRHLTRETLRKRARLDEQKNQLKQIEADVTSLATNLKELKSRRAHRKS